MEKKILKDYPMYEIYNNGQIYSLYRNRMLNTHITYDGYEKISIYNKNKKRVHLGVHKLVAMAFIPNPENKIQVNHIDGNKRNNNVSNLEWTTPKENDYHSRHILGNNWVGEKHPRSKYSDKQVKQVINMINDGKTNKEILKEIDSIKIGLLYDIRNNNQWGNLKIEDKNKTIIGNRLLTHDEIMKVIELLNSGLSAPKISAITGATTHTIYGIKSGKVYKSYYNLLK